MFKFNFLKICALSAALMSMSMVHSLSAEKRCHSDTNNFRVRDFVGIYTIDLDSTGGVSGESGDSFTGIGQLQFNADGTGVVTFFSVAVYSGPIGSAPYEFSTTTPVTFNWTLQDNNIGLVYIPFSVPTAPPQNVILELIANKSGSKVQSLTGHVINQSEAIAVGSFNLTRQFQ